MFLGDSQNYNWIAPIENFVSFGGQAFVCLNFCLHTFVVAVMLEFSLLAEGTWHITWVHDFDFCCLFCVGVMLGSSPTKVDG